MKSIQLLSIIFLTSLMTSNVQANPFSYALDVARGKVVLGSQLIKDKIVDCITTHPKTVTAVAISAAAVGYAYKQGYFKKMGHWAKHKLKEVDRTLDNLENQVVHTIACCFYAR